MKTYKDKRDINKEESEMNQKYTQKIENAPLRVICKRVKKVFKKAGVFIKAFNVITVF